MEGHDERGVIAIFGQQFHPYLDVNVALAIVDFSKFTHFATFRKAQIFDCLHILLNSQLLKLPLQSNNRVFIRKLIRYSKAIRISLISALVYQPFFLKCDFCAMIQRILQILKICTYIQFTLNPSDCFVHCSIPPKSYGIN